MHECSHVIFGPRQTHGFAVWRVFTLIYFEPRQKLPALVSGRPTHREGPSLRDVFAERETGKFYVKPYTHLPDVRSADLHGIVDIRSQRSPSRVIASSFAWS